MTTVNEQRSLIMDRNTLQRQEMSAYGHKTGVLWSAAFYPIADGENLWLEQLRELFLKSKGHLPIEIGNLSFDPTLDTATKTAIARQHLTGVAESLVGGAITHMTEGLDDAPCFHLSFVATGPMADILTMRLDAGEPIIFSSKALVTREGEKEILRDITGLQCLENDFLKIPVSKEHLFKLGYSVWVSFGNAILNRITPPCSKETLADVKRVLIVNAAAGNTTPTPEEFENQIMRQTRIDLLESLEFLDAVIKGDASELRDGLADKRITLGGFSNILPISLSDDFENACDNQFTRFDKDYEKALKTQEKYAAIGVVTEIHRNLVGTGNGVLTFFANIVVEDATGTNGEFYPKGKFVKSINYTKDQFKEHDGIVFDTSIEASRARWEKIRSVLLKFIADTDQSFTTVVSAE